MHASGLKKITGIVGFLAALLMVTYWPGLHGDFFFDDGPSILWASGVEMNEFSWVALQQAWFSGGAGPTGRPVAQISFALNHYLSGFDPFAFKVTNLAIHAVCGLLVFGLVRHLFRDIYPREPQQWRRLVSIGVAALWLMHPLQLLPVLHVVQRMTSLSALFLLAALWTHMAARELGGRKGVSGLVVAWFILWPLSCLSKETGLLFPLFVLAWELLVRRRVAGRLDGLAWALCGVLGVVALGLGLYLMSDRAQWIWAGYEMRDFSMKERLLTQGRVLWFYLQLMVLPKLSDFGLYHDDIEISTNWLTPWTTLPSMVGLMAGVWLAWRLRARVPLASLGLAWFFIGHAMESTLLPLEIAHEHRNYLPLLGAMLPVGAALMAARKLGPRQMRVCALLGVIGILGLVAITALRAYQFGEEVRRTQMAAQQHPRSAQAQYEAGSTLVQLPSLALGGDSLHALARWHLLEANKLNPSGKTGWLGLIYLDCKIGRIPEEEYVRELADRLNQTVLGPADRNVLYQVKQLATEGALCLKRESVENLFAAALENPTASPGVRSVLWSWLADYLWLSGRDLVAARKALSQSLRLDTLNPSNRLKWAQLQYISGEYALARQSLLAVREMRLTVAEHKLVEELLGTITIRLAQPPATP